MGNVRGIIYFEYYDRTEYINYFISSTRQIAAIIFTDIAGYTQYLWAGMSRKHVHFFTKTADLKAPHQGK